MRKSATKHILLGTVLLGTTALVSPAMAQNIVVVGPGGTGVLSSNNQNTVTATFSVPGADSLTDGVQNTQGALGTAASAFATISQTIADIPAGINLTTVPTNSVTATGGFRIIPTISAVNSAAGTVEASIGIPGAVTITNGVADSIIAQATGAAATASISSVVDNVATVTKVRRSHQTQWRSLQVWRA